MKKYTALLLVVSGVWMLFGCKGTITVDEAYNTIRPVKQLELPDQVDDNLVIIINNVADEGSSYKNRLDLFINDYKVNPDWLVSNVQNKYVYRLRMRPGYYEIKAFYYAYVGWGEDKYEIKTEELVRVQHDQRTIVTADIVKKPNGEPVNKKTWFSARYEDFADKTPAPKEPPQTQLPEEPVLSDLLTLQINTVPENAQIIIDDKVVGQAPLRYEVSRNEDHVIQISADGFVTKTRLIERLKTGNKNVFHVIQELEKE